MSQGVRLAAVVVAAAVLAGCSASQAASGPEADEETAAPQTAAVDYSTMPGFQEMKARCFNGVANQPQRASQVLSSGVDTVAGTWVTGAGYSPGSRIYDAAVAGCAYGIADSMAAWGYAPPGAALKGAPPTTTTTAPRPCPTGQPTITVEETVFDPYEMGDTPKVIPRITISVTNGTSAPVTPNVVLFSVISEAEKVLVERNVLDVEVAGDRPGGLREIEVGGSHNYDQVDFFDESIPAGSTASLTGSGRNYYFPGEQPRVVVNEIAWHWTESEFHDCPTESIRFGN